VTDPGIHSTRDVNKIIKYNDNFFFFFLCSLYMLYFYYNMVNTIKKKKLYCNIYIYISQKTYLYDFISIC
jgi:hypothetical protein